MTDKESLGLIDQYIEQNFHRVKPIPIEKMSTNSHILASEINTFSFRNLFNTALQIFGTLELVKAFLLEGVEMDRCYLVTRDNPNAVEPFHLVHLLQDDFWISNFISSCILENAEKYLKGSILGEDPLFEAAKRLKLSTGISPNPFFQGSDIVLLI